MPASPPGPNDDATRGWEAGKTWIDSWAKTVYLCVDPKPGAAIWKPMARMEDMQSSSGITQSTLDTAIAGKANAADLAALTSALATASAALATKAEQGEVAGKADRSNLPPFARRWPHPRRQPH